MLSNIINLAGSLCGCNHHVSAANTSASHPAATDLNGVKTSSKPGPESIAQAILAALRHGPPAALRLQAAQAVIEQIPDSQGAANFIDSDVYRNIPASQKGRALVGLVEHISEQMARPSSAWPKIYHELQRCEVFQHGAGKFDRDLLRLLVAVLRDRFRSICDNSGLATDRAAINVAELFGAIAKYWHRSAHRQDAEPSYSAVLADPPIGDLMGMMQRGVFEQADLFGFRVKHFELRWLSQADGAERQDVAPLVQSCRNYARALKQFVDRITWASEPTMEILAHSLCEDLFAIDTARTALREQSRKVVATVDAEPGTARPRLIHLAEHCRIFDSEAYVSPVRSLSDQQFLGTSVAGARAAT